MTNVLKDNDDILVEERANRAVIKTTLGPHEIAIYKKKEG
jgi:hypothetical protein